MTQWVMETVINKWRRILAISMLALASCSDPSYMDANRTITLSDDDAIARTQLLERFPVGSSAEQAKTTLTNKGFICMSISRGDRAMSLGMVVRKRFLSTKNRSIGIYYDEYDAITNILTHVWTVKAWDPHTY
jgi:hypothetical protein